MKEVAIGLLVVVIVYLVILVRHMYKTAHSHKPVVKSRYPSPPRRPRG